MFKKALIAGLLVSLFIQKCKHIEDLKKKKKQLSITEIDSILDKSGLELTHRTSREYREFRINLKGLLYAAGVLEGADRLPYWSGRNVK